MVLILQQITFAQQNNISTEKANPLVDETVFITLNSSTFVNGETLFYKLNCLKNSDKKPTYQRTHKSPSDVLNATTPNCLLK